MVAVIKTNEMQSQRNLLIIIISKKMKSKTLTYEPQVRKFSLRHSLHLASLTRCVKQTSSW
jgi:hypothetical protein